MSITVMVWVMILSVTSSNGPGVMYSPAVATLSDCERLQGALSSDWLRERSKCVQVGMVFPGVR